MLSRKYYIMLARVINNNSIKLMPNDLILKSSLINDLSNELKKIILILIIVGLKMLVMNK